MAFILPDVLDISLRQSMLMGDGSPLITVTRPISATILAATVLVLIAQAGFHRALPLAADDA